MAEETAGQKNGAKVQFSLSARVRESSGFTISCGRPPLIGAYEVFFLISGIVSLRAGGARYDLSPGSVLALNDGARGGFSGQAGE